MRRLRLGPEDDDERDGDRTFVVAVDLRTATAHSRNNTKSVC